MDVARLRSSRMATHCTLSHGTDRKSRTTARPARRVPVQERPGHGPLRRQGPSLRSRVKSYFLESRWADAKTGSLVREIADLDYIVVDNEREALALENNLIKQYQPNFNVLLRDDKTYPYIRFTA